MHRCSKHSRAFCWFCITQTIGFPIEHLMWEKAPILSSITHIIGL